MYLRTTDKVSHSVLLHVNYCNFENMAIVATIHSSVAQSYQSIISFLPRYTKARRTKDISLPPHYHLPPDVPHSFCRFNYKVLTKLDMTRGKSCRHSELSCVETTRPSVVLLEFKQLFHLIVSTVVMTRKSGRQRRCRQAGKQAKLT